MKKTEEQIEAHRRLCEHFDDTLLGDGTVYPCENECPYMKQFINEDSDGNIETNHSDGRA